MIPVTFQSAAAYLLDDFPEWSAGIELEAAMPTDKDSAITGRETRRPVGESLRLALRYSATVTGPALSQLRNSLQAITTEKVLCPLWVFPIEPGTTTPEVTAEFYVLTGDELAPAIEPAAGLPFARPAYPLLIGRLGDVPMPDLLRPDLARVSFSFLENDPLAITPPAFTPPAGIPGYLGAPLALFPFRPEWTSTPKSGAASVDIEREVFPERRESADAFFAQASRRDLSLYFVLVDEEVGQFLAFLSTHAQQSFWVPVAMQESELTADVLAADTSITVSDPAARGDNTTVLLDDGTARAPLVITGTVGNDWTLADPVGTDFAAAHTLVESLILGRLLSTSVALAFAAPGVATLRLSFIETPDELTRAAAQEAVTFGFIFEIGYPVSPYIALFTSFERTVGDYIAAPLEASDVRLTATMDRQQLNIRSRHFDGNPLSLFLPFALEWPLKITLVELQLSGGLIAGTTEVFTGEISSVVSDGPLIRATATSLANFDRKIPRRLLQPGCNWALFEPACGVALNDWRWSGTVVSYNPSTFELLLSGVARYSGSGITLTAHFFAGGHLYTGTGAAVQFRTISDNDAAAGTDITLVLASPFSVAPSVGATVTFHPGCDGRYSETCVARYNNAARFGGFPYMPIGNPSMVKVAQNTSSGGKK